MEICYVNKAPQPATACQMCQVMKASTHFANRCYSIAEKKNKTQHFQIKFGS